MQQPGLEPGVRFNRPIACHRRQLEPTSAAVERLEEWPETRMLGRSAARGLPELETKR